MNIAIASGKGGTGKTTVSVNLYYFLSKEFDNKVQLIDCDVEEPNDLLFFAEHTLESSKEVKQKVPFIDTAQCTFCRKCAEYCEFNAIVVIPQVKFAEVIASLCHSCEACFYACEQDAIKSKFNPIGEINQYEVGHLPGVLEGRLEIGSAMQTALIRELICNADTEAEILIFDAPPGTSCSVVETVANVNYVILVTEPTPFGLHDLKLSVELLKELQKNFGIVINKSGLGNDEVYNYIQENDLELIGEIPFSKQFAVGYAKGNLMQELPDSVDQSLKNISDTILKKCVV